MENLVHKANSIITESSSIVLLEACRVIIGFPSKRRNIRGCKTHNSDVFHNDYQASILSCCMHFDMKLPEKMVFGGRYTGFAGYKKNGKG